MIIGVGGTLLVSQLFDKLVPCGSAEKTCLRERRKCGTLTSSGIERDVLGGVDGSDVIESFSDVARLSLQSDVAI